MALHRDVAFDAALGVEDLAVDDPPFSHVNLCGTNAVEICASIWPLHHNLAKGRLIEQRRAMTAGRDLGADLFAPFGNAKGQGQVVFDAAEMLDPFPAGSGNELGICLL